MTINEFLSSPEAFLPKSRKPGDFADYYESITNNYFSLLSNFDDNGAISSKIIENISVSVQIRDAVLKSIRQYLNGHPSAAYASLKKVVKSNASLFSKLISKPVEIEYLKNLYRIRIIDDHFFDRREMFHIPFDLRHLVKSQRYSIPGFPSLYLSSSIYTAWKELSCPDLNKMAVVRVEPTEKVKFLNFGCPPLYLAQNDIDYYNRLNPVLNSEFGLLASQIIAWPLLAACSISVLEKNAPFKPEYIIPQLVLQLIRNNVFGNDVHGVRYFSTKYGNKYHSVKLGSNFVFPVKASQPSGLCANLQRLFYLTEPISWQLANVVTAEFDATKTNDGGIEIITGVPFSYQSTQFARVEVNLIEQTATPL